MRLRLEWVALMREYSRTRHRSALAEAHLAHQRYLDRAEQLRSAEEADASPP